MLLLPLLCIFLALESAGAQEAGDSTPSRNLASKLERRLDDLIAANKQEAIETCNDYFYVLSRIGASQKARLGALEKIQARLSSDDSDWIGLRTDYLLSNYPVTSAQDLQTVNLAITMGAHSFFLTESETFDLAQRIAAIKSNDLHDIELKMRTLYLLSEQARSDFDFKKKFCLAALEAGMSKQAMADDHLHGLFYALLYCYDRPSSRTEEHDFRLVKAVQDLTQNATVNMKHEFLINPFPGGLFSEIRLCSNSETLQSTLTTLAEKMESIGASKSAIADAFTEVGCAYLLTDNYDSATQALQHALELHRDSAIINSVFPLVARITLAESFRRSGEFDKSIEQLHKVMPESAFQSATNNYPAYDTHCFPAYAQTMEGMILVKQRKFGDAVGVLSLADNWWRYHQSEEDHFPCYHKYLLEILPGEVKCLEALSEALEATGKHKAAGAARADIQKVLSSKAKPAEEVKQGNNSDAQSKENELSEATGAGLTSLKFDAQLCARIIQDRYSPARVPVPASCKYQILDYCHALSTEKRYDEAERAALAVLQSKCDNSGECGSLLAFIYIMTGHARLAKATIIQVENRIREEIPLSVPGLASNVRSQSYVNYYAGLIALQSGNELRAQRLFFDARRWLEQPVLKDTPLAEKLERQIREAAKDNCL